MYVALLHIPAGADGSMWEMNMSPMRPKYEDIDVKAFTAKLHEYGCTIGWQYGTMGSPVGPLTYTEPFIGNYPTEKVHEWIKTIGDLAETLQRDGFDAIELNMAANNLGQSFFSRERNNRTDEYGAQNMDNRCRFCVEAIQEIKNRCGKDFIVQVLINGLEQDDKNFDNSLLTSLPESIEIAKRIEAAGADSLHVRIAPQIAHIGQFASDLYFCARGLEGSNSIQGNVFDFKRHFDGRLNATHHGYGLFHDVAAEFKKAVSIPVGCPVDNDPAAAPDLFNSAIADGKFDFLIMNRPLCVDPEYVNKLREGRLDEIAPCTRCLHCFYDVDLKGHTMEHCRVNAANWRAFHPVMPEGYVPVPATEEKKIMVIGDGEITFTNMAGYPETIACDAVVEGMDMLPNKSLAEELSDFNVVCVGDCDIPFNISEAISSGNLAARAI